MVVVVVGGGEAGGGGGGGAYIHGHEMTTALKDCIQTNLSLLEYGW